MSVQIDVAANHGGFWECSVCDSKDINQDCFDRNKLKTCAAFKLLIPANYHIAIFHLILSLYI